MKDTMTHEEIKAAFSELYNKFYLKHRLPPGQERTDEEWQGLMEDAACLRKKYDSILVTNMLNELMDEFERQNKQNTGIDYA